MASIYVASKTKHAARWRALRAAGVPIISTWIDEDCAGQTGDWGDLWCRCIDEARSATAIIVYHEPGETPKGSLVEIGAALAAGTRVYAVGVGAEHTWTAHPGVTVESTVYGAFYEATHHDVKRRIDWTAVLVALGAPAQSGPSRAPDPRFNFDDTGATPCPFLPWGECIHDIDEPEPTKAPAWKFDRCTGDMLSPKCWDGRLSQVARSIFSAVSVGIPLFLMREAPSPPCGNYRRICIER